MSEYTPTTEQVEEAFIYQDFFNERFNSAEQAGEAFYRWLAGERAKAILGVK